MNTRHPPCKRGGRPSVGSKDGFTLVELMVAAAAGSVLALTAGFLLFIASSILVRTSDHQGMQRDATFAMDIIERAAQSSKGSEISIASGQMTLATNHVRAATSRFYSDSQGNLIYDPNLSVGGNEVKVVTGRLTAFSATVVSNRLWVILGLREDTKSMTLTNCVTFRNGT